MAFEAPFGEGKQSNVERELMEKNAMEAALAKQRQEEILRKRKERAKPSLGERASQEGGDKREAL